MKQSPQAPFFILALIKVTRTPLILGTQYSYEEAHGLAKDVDFIWKSANQHGWHLNGVSTQVFEADYLDALLKIEAGTPAEHGVKPLLVINGV